MPVSINAGKKRLASRNEAGGADWRNTSQDLNLHKAAGPDELKPLVLKELSEVIAPMLRVIFQRSIEAGRSQGIGMTQMCAFYLRKLTKVLPPIIGPYH